MDELYMFESNGKLTEILDPKALGLNYEQSKTPRKDGFKSK